MDEVGAFGLCEELAVVGVGVEVVEEGVELGEGEWFPREAQGFFQVDVFDSYVVDVGVAALDSHDAGFLAPCEADGCLLVEAFEGYPVGGQADPLPCGRADELFLKWIVCENYSKYERDESYRE